MATKKASIHGYVLVPVSKKTVKRASKRVASKRVATARRVASKKVATAKRSASKRVAAAKRVARRKK